MRKGTTFKTSFQKEDIPILLKSHFLDFKPHFYLDDSYTAHEFAQSFFDKKLDTFFKKHCIHSYVEWRCFDPHWEENGMVLARYVMNIVENIDVYIKNSNHLDWQESKRAAKAAIFCTDARKSLQTILKNNDDPRIQQAISLIPKHQKQRFVFDETTIK